jgi:hypothetical protein
MPTDQTAPSHKLLTNKWIQVPTRWINYNSSKQLALINCKERFKMLRLTAAKTIIILLWWWEINSKIKRLLSGKYLMMKKTSQTKDQMRKTKKLQQQQSAIYKLSRVTQVWWAKHLKSMWIKDLRSIREFRIRKMNLNKKVMRHP